VYKRQDLKVIRAGYANLFQSKVFAQTLATISDTTIELYNTDGAEGAARGAAVGMGFYQTNDEAFKELKCIEKIVPQEAWRSKLESAYNRWQTHLNHLLKSV
jgi:xylulokinase